MSLVKWIAAQQKQKQINTVTVSGTPAAGNVATVTMNGKSITYTVLTGDTISLVASGLVALLQAAEDGEFSLISWSVSAAVITATAAEAGVPFTTTGTGTLAVTSTGGGATTLTAASVQVNKSPNDANDVLNYSSGTLPIAGDTLLLENGSEGIYWNLSALSAITIGALTVRDTFVVTSRDCWVGNPTIHPTLGFREFRGLEFTLQGATALEIDLATSAGSGAFRLNVSAAACAGKIIGGGGGSIDNEAVHWRGTNAANTWEVYGGSLLIEPQHFSSSGTAVLTTLKAINAAVRLEAGVTVSTSADVRDTQLDSRVSIPTILVNGDSSEVTMRDTATCATQLAIDAGTVFWNSTGTLSVVKGGSGGALNFNGAKGAVTVGSGTGTVAIDEGFTYTDSQRRTFPFGNATTLLLNRTGLAGVTLDFGENVYLQVTQGP